MTIRFGDFRTQNFENVSSSLKDDWVGSGETGGERERVQRDVK